VCVRRGLLQPTAGARAVTGNDAWQRSDSATYRGCRAQPDKQAGYVPGRCGNIWHCGREIPGDEAVSRVQDDVGPYPQGRCDSVALGLSWRVANVKNEKSDGCSFRGRLTRGGCTSALGVVSSFGVVDEALVERKVDDAERHRCQDPPAKTPCCRRVWPGQSAPWRPSAPLAAHGVEALTIEPLFLSSPWSPPSPVVSTPMSAMSAIYPCLHRAPSSSILSGLPTGACGGTHCRPRSVTRLPGVAAVMPAQLLPEAAGTRSRPISPLLPIPATARLTLPGVSIL
jgi:hypothetical protein